MPTENRKMKPTNKLRWLALKAENNYYPESGVAPAVVSPHMGFVLQQQWTNKEGHEEWREIEVTYE